jgi:hypothetical protein
MRERTLYSMLKSAMLGMIKESSASRQLAELTGVALWDPDKWWHASGVGRGALATIAREYLEYYMWESPS